MNLVFIGDFDHFLWTMRCSFRLLIREKAFSHSAQTYFLIFSCTSSMCLSISLLMTVAWGQWSHLNFSLPFCGQIPCGSSTDTFMKVSSPQCIPGKRNIHFKDSLYRLVQKKRTVLLITSLAWPAVAGCSRAETFSQLSAISFAWPCTWRRRA